ncbi:calcipressin-1-like isoform X1 [Embiotoca jacksoni]|uniref:calcipressin-1-like isoform X1 n=1 Tax=Embiotoca jacksoni TaxID=100190 RepID=UPI0037049B53
MLFRAPRLPPSSSSSSPSPSSSPASAKLVSASRRALTSVIRWKGVRLPGSPVAHVRTTRRNRYCLVATATNQEVFHSPRAQASFEALFHSFDTEVRFQYFKSFRRVRISFSNAPAAAEARLRLHKTDFNGKEMRLYFAQSVHIGSPRLEPPKPDKQFLISPPASPPVGWEQAQDATPVINYDLLCAISKLGPGGKYELQTATPTTPSVVIHVCDDEGDERPAPPGGGGGGDRDDEARPPRPKIVQTRRPDYTPGVEQ